MAWFAVRTFLRSRPVGRPKRRDATYRAGVAAIEERIVLVRAKNADAALKKGRSEALEYARSARVTNVYGQTVVRELLHYVEAYEMFDDPGDGAEVFSSIEIVSARESEASVVRRKAGESASAKTARLFIAGSIAEQLNDRLGDW
jgi:uncharacterized protein DUF4288